MSKPRAQRQVAPPHPPRLAASSAGAEPKRDPDDSFIVFGHAILRREIAGLIASKPRLESSPTPEEIHQLRVAARRLRIALRLLGRMLPSAGAARFQADLKWFASSLGDIRDLDVYTERFKAYVQALPPKQRSGLSAYQMYLRRERGEARQRAAAAASSPRAAKLLADLEGFAATGPSPGALRRWGALSVRDAMRQGIRRSIGRVRRLGSALQVRARPAQLHELRIKTKRLRYELEFFADVHPPLNETAKECKAIQDLLGTHQDVYAGTARLRRYAASLRKHGADGTLPAALAQLRKDQLAVAREVRRSFRAKWPAFVATLAATRKLVA